MSGKVRHARISAIVAILLSVGVARVNVNGRTSKDKDTLSGIHLLPGLGSLSGTVKAPKEFKAAKVYAKNLERNVVYMVYTEAGIYRVADLFPGTYEVSVTKNGFSGGDAQTVTVTAGGNTTADFMLKEGTYRPSQRLQMRSNNWPELQGEPLYTYDALYPPGEGRAIAERTCIRCHGPDFLPNKKWDVTEWNAAIDMMESTSLATFFPGRMSATSVPEGVSPKERELLLDYLVKNFGPNNTPRGLAVPEAPIDEAALGKAMYIEYLVPPLPDGKPRRLQDPHLSQNGDLWYVDREAMQIGNVDPRTAKWTDYAISIPAGLSHGITQDSSGDIWFSGRFGFGRVDSETGKMRFYPYYSPPSKRPPEGNTPAIDSKQNVWASLMYTNEIAKWDRKTGEVSRFAVPTPYSSPYGAVVDKKDNVWIAEFLACKLTRLDPESGLITEFSPLTRPCTVRRLSVDHNNKIWFALDSTGEIGMLDPEMGKIVEYPEPMKFSFPYDIQEDHDYNLWVSDAGQGGAQVKFDRNSKKFTYYPTIQRTDMPKIEISGENSIWYTTRASNTQAVGVLYPDKSKIVTLAASY
jgi:virginiamycin B lyase